jgi:membrane protease YdiL (CAAX protease family)
MWILGFIFVAIIGPLAEELNFRGYLLPILSKLGKWAPLVNFSLFILYYFWQPNALAPTTLNLSHFFHDYQEFP